jgi:hypothetical protein
MYNNNTVFGHYAGSRLQFETLYSGPTSQNFYRNFVGERSLNGTNPLFRKGPDLKIVRNSIGSFFNSGGVIDYVPANTARFEWGPDGVFRGLLVEEQRINYVAYSQNFIAGDNQPLGWLRTNTTFIGNAGTSPDFTNTATLVSAQPSLGFRGFRNEPNFGFNVDLYSRSIFVKANVGRYLAFCVANPLALFVAQIVRIFDLQTKNWVPFGPGGLLGDADPDKNAFELPFQVLPNDWIRIGIVNEPSNDNTNKYYIGMAATSAWGSANFTNTGNLGSFYVWGAQYEKGAFPSSYIPTQGTIISRAADNITTIALSGLYNHQESSFYIKGSRISSDLQGSFGGFSQGSSQYFELAGGPNNLRTNQGAFLKYNLTTAQVILSSPPNEPDITYTLITSTSSNLDNLTYFYYAQDQTFVGETTSSGTPPLIGTRFRLGQTFNSNYLNGHIKEFGYWPTYLPYPTLSSLIEY